MIRQLIGDATRPEGKGPRVIVHVCNDSGGWGRGFVVAISKRWKDPESSYRDWYKASEPDGFKLGAVRFVPVEPNLWVANLIGQHNTGPTNGVPPVRYDAIRRGLAEVRNLCQQQGASVHMPRIGCGLAGGNWTDVGAIVEEELAAFGIEVTVYDLPERENPIGWQR